MSNLEYILDLDTALHPKGLTVQCGKHWLMNNSSVSPGLTCEGSHWGSAQSLVPTVLHPWAEEHHVQCMELRTLIVPSADVSAEWKAREWNKKKSQGGSKLSASFLTSSGGSRFPPSTALLSKHLYRQGHTGASQHPMNRYYQPYFIILFYFCFSWPHWGIWKFPG